MKALTLSQPWATLVAVGAKRIETRSWATSYRGPLAIHAAKTFPRDARDLCFQEPFRTALGREFGQPVATYAWLNTFPRGAVVATCELVDVIPIIGPHDEYKTDGWWVSVDRFVPGDLSIINPGTSRAVVVTGERPFGDFTPGRYAWILADVKALPEPIPARGALGLWEWDHPTEEGDMRTQPATIENRSP